MTVVVIIQARMGSTRLPGKVLQDLAGKPVLARVVDAAQQIVGVDRVAVATSAAAADDVLVQWCARNNVSCHRGSENDVLARFAQAAEAEGADIVLRITADCPLLDPAICAMVLALLRRTGADYASNFDPRSWPDGLDCEAFTAATLKIAQAEAKTSYDREHVTPFLRNNKTRFKVEALVAPVPAVAEERWTLDTQADLEFLRAIVGKLGEPPYSWIEVLDLLDREPALRMLNRADKQTATLSISDLPAIEPRSYGLAGSRALFDRAVQSIPLASQTFSKSHIQYPENAPRFLSFGDGCRVWDVDGNEYVDLVSALLPVVLGYRDPDVDDSIRRQLGRGISMSLATQEEVRLAELLREVIPCAELVRFGKNGSDATSAAIRLARAFTGRDRVAVCGYHGWQDWYIGSTTRDKGVPRAVGQLTHSFPYNDVQALDDLLKSHPKQFAAVMMEPVGAVEPKPGYLAAVRDCAHDHGALLVFDEVISGFRIALGGAQEYFGVTPDLAAVGKAMANGMPISAIVGRADVMDEMKNIFFSGTFGGEVLSIAAAIATIEKIRSNDVIHHLWSIGKMLADGTLHLISQYGLTDWISLLGLAPWKILSIRDHPTAPKEAIKTMFLREVLGAGVLVNASHNVSYALKQADVAQVLAAYKAAFATVGSALASGTLLECLGEPPIQPVFSVRKTA